MGLSKTIKTNARHALSGHWGRAIGILLLVVVPSLLLQLLEFCIRAIGGIDAYIDYNQTSALAFDDLSNVSLVSALVSILMLLLTLVVIVPLLQGATRWYYRRTGGEEDGIGELFFCFETSRQYFKSLWLHLQISIRFLFWLVLLCLPLAGGGYLMHTLTAGSHRAELPISLTAIASLLAIVWSILAGILLVFIALRYFLAPYLLAEYPEQRSWRSVRQSIRLMRGQKAAVFGFLLSFLPWWLLGIGAWVLPFLLLMVNPSLVYEAAAVFLALSLLQALLLIYAGPYISTSCALYARYLIQRNALPLEESPTVDLPEENLQEETVTREYNCPSETSPE